MKMLRILRQMSFGIAVAALIVIGTALYVDMYGPLYDVWGWPELVLGSLILGIFALAGVATFLRSPNPYARTNPLYNLRDVPPGRDLDSGGIGWAIQAIPLAATTIVLIVFFLVT